MPPAITSKQNPRIKLAAALRNRGERDARRQTLVYGARETQRALAAGAELVEAFVCSDLLRGANAQSTAEQLTGDPRTFTVTPEVFEHLAYGDRLDGVISIVRTAARGLADLTLPADPLIAVIEGSEKPGNLGAILRSADGAGVDAIIVADAVIDLFNPNTIRASVGGRLQTERRRRHRSGDEAWLQRHAIRGYALRPDAQRVLQRRQPHRRRGGAGRQQSARPLRGVEQGARHAARAADARPRRQFERQRRRGGVVLRSPPATERKIGDADLRGCGG